MTGWRWKQLNDDAMRKEAERLAERIEQMREEARRDNIPIRIKRYIVMKYPLSRKIGMALCGFSSSLVVDIVYLILRTAGIEMIWAAFALQRIAFALMLISAIALIYFINLERARSEIEEVGYSQRDLSYLSNIIASYEDKLEKIREKEAKKKPLLQKIMRLKPIFTEKLKGKFELKSEFGEYHVRAEVDGKVRTFVVYGEAIYIDLVLWIVETRNRHRVVEDFEAELELAEYQRNNPEMRITRECGYCQNVLQ